MFSLPPTPILTGYLRYRAFIKNTLSKKTVKRYTTAMDNFYQRFKDRKNSSDFYRWDFEGYRDTRKAEGIKDSTISLELHILTSWWDWMCEHRMAPYNPVRLLGGDVDAKKGSLSLQSVEVLLSNCYSLRDKLLVLLPLTSGLRIVEISRLRWEDVDFTTNTLHIQGDAKARGRIVPLREDVKELLLLLPYHSPRVLPHHQEFLWQLFRAICIRSGMPSLGMTPIRNTFATHLLLSGVEKAWVKILMGHTPYKRPPIQSMEIVRSKLLTLPSLPKEYSPSA